MTRTSPRVRRTAAAVAAAGLCTAGVSGCTTHAGAAATVGGTRIDTASLRDTVNRADLTKLSSQVGGVDGLQRLDLSTLVRRVLIQRVAAQRHVTVADADVTRIRSQFEQQYGGPSGLASTLAQQGVTGPDVTPFLRDDALLVALETAAAKRLGASSTTAQAAAQSEVRADLDRAERAAKVSVNPRFGAWNPAQFSVVAAADPLAAAPTTSPPPAGVLPGAPTP